MFVCSLGGPRTLEALLRLIPAQAQESSRLVLHVIKHWATVNYLHSKAVGFLGGVCFAVLVIFIARKNPGATADEMLGIVLQVLFWRKTHANICCGLKKTIRVLDLGREAHFSGIVIPLQLLSCCSNWAALSSIVLNTLACGHVQYYSETHDWKAPVALEPVARHDQAWRPRKTDNMAILTPATPASNAACFMSAKAVAVFQVCQSHITTTIANAFGHAEA